MSTSQLLPEYDWCIEPVLHLRCTKCGGWLVLERSQPNRAYSCPHCGVKLAPAQYPDDPPQPRPRRSEEVPL